MNVLQLGIPKGSLEAATIELFRRSGWKIRTDSRSYFPTVDDPALRCLLVRAQEMAPSICDSMSPDEMSWVTTPDRVAALIGATETMTVDAASDSSPHTHVMPPRRSSGVGSEKYSSP